MAAPRIFRAHRPLSDEPKHFTRIPDDALEDPRLTKTQLAVFTNLLKGRWTNETTIVITQVELAERTRVTDRCIRDALRKLEDCGYIRRDRDRLIRGAPHRIELCFELRPTLKLEDQPPVTSGSKSASNRNRGSGPDRKPPFRLDADSNLILCIRERRERNDDGNRRRKHVVVF